MRNVNISTSYVVMLKAFLASDHVTAATGKTIAIVISKAGSAFANPSAGATNATEVSGGWYQVTLSTTDTNTLGDLVVRGTEGTIDPTEQIIQIRPAYTVVGDIPTAAANATAVWGQAVPGAFGAGTAGNVLGNNLNAVVGTRFNTIDTNIAALPSAATIGTAVWAVGTRQLTAAQTFNLTGSITGNLSGTVGSVTGAVGSVASGGIAAASFAANAVDAAALATNAAQEIADALLDRTDGIETSWTIREGMRVMLGVLAGPSTGMGTTTPVMKNPANSKTRVTGTTDASGNRSGLAYDKT